MKPNKTYGKEPKILFKSNRINLVKLKLKFNEQFMKEGQRIIFYDELIKAKGTIVSMIYINR